MKEHQTWKRAANAGAAVAIALAASTAWADTDTPTTPSNWDPDSFGH